MGALLAAALRVLRIGQHGVFLAVVEEVVHDLQFKVVAFVVGEDDNIALVLHGFAPRFRISTPIVPQMQKRCKRNLGNGARSFYFFCAKSRAWHTQEKSSASRSSRWERTM